MLLAITVLWANFVYPPQNEFVYQQLTDLNFPKPWIYRQLVPLLVRFFVELGLSINVSLLVTLLLSVSGFYLSVNKILESLGKKETEIPSILIALSGLILFSYESSPYDLMTAFLWSLSFLFVQTRNTLGMTLLFPFICLNRVDTAIFILVAWGLVHGNLLFVGLQGVFYGLIRYMLFLRFADNPGLSAWVTPIQNILTYAEFPLVLWFVLGVICLVGLMFLVAKTRTKNNKLANIFILFAPLFLLLHLVFGQPMEIRIFWEIYPLVVLIFL